MRFIIISGLVVLLGAGCTQRATESTKDVVVNTNDSSLGTGEAIRNSENEILKDPVVTQDLVVPPIDPEAPWGYHATLKIFGQFVNDRFYGYHAGEDVEVFPEFEGKDIEVRSVADGYIVYKNWVGGYGGVVIVEHEIAGELYRSLYGHLDLGSVTQDVGELLQKGEVFALLGDPYSTQTDGERKHLHFSVWRGNAVQIAGYVATEEELAKWLNPQDFYQL